MDNTINEVKKYILNLVHDNKLEQDVIFDALERFKIDSNEEVLDDILSYLSKQNIEILEDTNNIKIDNDFDTNSNNSLANYLHEISKYSLLKPEEELHLGKIIMSGVLASEELAKNPAKVELNAKINAGIEARNELANRNRRLVVAWAKKYLYSNLSLDDLIGEGNLGLLTAASKFDYRKNIKFSTYASYWINQKMSLAIKNSGKTIRIPLSTQKQIIQVKKIQRDLIDEKGRQPSYQEISDALGEPYTKDKVKQLLIIAQDHVISLDEVKNGKGNSNDGHDMYDVIDNGEPSLMEEKDNKEQQDILSNEALSCVSDKEKDIIKRFYGIGCEKMTLESIGKIYNNVSKERIRQIKDLAIRKIKKHMKEK